MTHGVEALVPRRVRPRLALNQCVAPQYGLVAVSAGFVAHERTRPIRAELFGRRFGIEVRDRPPHSCCVVARVEIRMALPTGFIAYISHGLYPGAGWRLFRTASSLTHHERNQKCQSGAKSESKGTRGAHDVRGRGSQARDLIRSRRKPKIAMRSAQRPGLFRPCLIAVQRLPSSR